MWMDGSIFLHIKELSIVIVYFVNEEDPVVYNLLSFILTKCKKKSLSRCASFYLGTVSTAVLLMRSELRCSGGVRVGMGV